MRKMSSKLLHLPLVCAVFNSFLYLGEKSHVGSHGNTGYHLLFQQKVIVSCVVVSCFLCTWFRLLLIRLWSNLLLYFFFFSVWMIITHNLNIIWLYLSVSNLITFMFISAMRANAKHTWHKLDVVYSVYIYLRFNLHFIKTLASDQLSTTSLAVIFIHMNSVF